MKVGYEDNGGARYKISATYILLSHSVARKCKFVLFPTLEVVSFLVDRIRREQGGEIRSPAVGPDVFGVLKPG